MNRKFAEGEYPQTHKKTRRLRPKERQELRKILQQLYGLGCATPGAQQRVRHEQQSYRY